MSITVEINEDDYRVAGSVPEFMDVGEYGPLECGCCIVATEIDPRGPRLVFIMQRKDAAWHEHRSLADFASVMPS